MVQQEYWAEMSRSFEVWEHIHVGMELSTVSLRGIEASDDRAVAGAINIASLVHGKVAYGDKEQRDGFPSTRGGRREPLQDAVGDHPGRRVAADRWDRRARVVQEQDHRSAN
jgi:hypothetical protein